MLPPQDYLGLVLGPIVLVHFIEKWLNLFESWLYVRNAFHRISFKWAYLPRTPFTRRGTRLINSILSCADPWRSDWSFAGSILNIISVSTVFCHRFLHLSKINEGLFLSLILLTDFRKELGIVLHQFNIYRNPTPTISLFLVSSYQRLLALRDFFRFIPIVYLYFYSLYYCTFVRVGSWLLVPFEFPTRILMRVVLEVNLWILLRLVGALSIIDVSFVWLIWLMVFFVECCCACTWSYLIFRKFWDISERIRLWILPLSILTIVQGGRAPTLKSNWLISFIEIWIFSIGNMVRLCLDPLSFGIDIFRGMLLL